MQLHHEEEIGGRRNGASAPQSSDPLCPPPPSSQGRKVSRRQFADDDYAMEKRDLPTQHRRHYITQLLVVNYSNDSTSDMA